MKRWSRFREITGHVGVKYAVSMRLSFDGLYALARHRMQQDPLSGHLFAFINRRATQIKVLYFDRSGLCVWSKRLEQGRLIGNWGSVTTQEMDRVEAFARRNRTKTGQKTRSKKHRFHRQNHPIKTSFAL